MQTIILKALEKDRDRRYQSVAELSRDVRHYLNREPITARPPSLAYLMRSTNPKARLAVGSGCNVVAGLDRSSCRKQRICVEGTTTEGSSRVFNSTLPSWPPLKVRSRAT